MDTGRSCVSAEDQAHSGSPLTPCAGTCSAGREVLGKSELTNEGQRYIMGLAERKKTGKAEASDTRRCCPFFYYLYVKENPQN